MVEPPPRRGSRRSKWRHGIDHRLERIPRYRSALLQSMADFGEDFDLELFISAYKSGNPATINAATAVEGSLGHIVNWLKQIADFGYHELLRLDRIQKSDGRPIDGLVEAGILPASDRERLMPLVQLRNRLQHDYPEVLPEEIHDAVLRTLELLPGLLERYGQMLKRIDG
jgi:Protein of unknown function DUF86